MKAGTLAIAAIASLAAAQPHKNAHKHQKRQAVVTEVDSPSSGSSGPGIAYSPYNSDNSCKSASQVKEDLAQLSSYPLIRLYGVDCNQVENVLAGKAAHQKIFAGIFNIGAVDSECDTLISAVGGKWGEIDTVSTGNELLNQHAASAQQLVTAINAAKAKLKPAGYSGPVVYVDTFNAMIAQNKIDSSLCEASDYSAANAHAFFNPTLVASDAGSWVKATAADIAASCPGKKVVITESGYPSAGLNNGLAVPSQANHAAAIESIKTSMATSDAGLILYSAYNDHWKVNAQWNFFAEQSWGIYGDAPSA